jgi:NAD(P)-dependent dehydrogenase (short-subunit alcohol dehydrogenase family)
LAIINKLIMKAQKMKLKGKVAIVTGSSQGIGSGIALKFAEEGADIVVNYQKNKNLADAVADKIRKLGSRALTVEADVSRKTDVSRLIQKTVPDL